MTTRLSRLREELNEALSKDSPTVSTSALALAVEELDKLEQAIIALKTENEGLAELEQIRLDAFKIQIERDAIAELHKQVIREVLNAANSNQETKDSGQTVQPSE